MRVNELFLETKKKKKKEEEKNGDYLLDSRGVSFRVSSSARIKEKRKTRLYYSKRKKNELKRRKEKAGN